MTLNAMLREKPADDTGQAYARQKTANTQIATSYFQQADLFNVPVPRVRHWRTNYARDFAAFYSDVHFGSFPITTDINPIVDDAVSVDEDRWERAFVELGSLEADDDFVPPKKSALADLEEIAEILRGPLPLRIRFPAIEHDSSTGIVSLAWFNPQSLSTFSISLLGGRKLYSIFVDPARNITRDFGGQTLDSRDLDQMWEVPDIATAVVDIRAEA